jgi:hypothetical protein
MTALAVLALFAGLASAQVSVSGAGTGALQCTANVAVPPILRSEGLTEETGDIVLTCQGGPTPTVSTAGAPLPILTANITVSFGANVTSRLLTSASLTPTLATTNASEALLLIDEPGSGLAIGPVGSGGVQPTTTWGPAAAQVLCPGSPAVGAGPGGCPEYVQQVGGEYVMSSSSSTALAAYNVFQGIVNSNQVTFFGVPIMPPTSANVARIFRMTNIRINASTFGGSLAGEQSVVASVSISGPTTLPIANPVITAGFVQPGLSSSTKVMNVGNSGGVSTTPYNQCSSSGSSSSPTPVGILQFAANFGTAFKTRTNAPGAINGQVVPSNQNVPGIIYNSESNFVFNALTANGFVAGLSDYGTRLKAVFNNIPAGVAIYVSTTNVVNLTNLAGSGGPAATASTDPLGNSTTPFAELVLTDTVIDGNGSISNVPATGFTSPSSSVVQVQGFAPVSIVSGTGTAVWEVLNTNTSTDVIFDFGVYLSYSANAAAGSPPVGTATVNLSYGPILASFPGTSATALASASGLPSITVPRFTDLTTYDNLYLFSIIQCSTSLLFPFITNQAGFDTGIALMNTTQDPFGTKPQAGTCAMWFYGQNAPTNPVTTPVIPSGVNLAPSGNWAFMASNIAPNFEGYMIAICQFQLAHGYAFISDLGAQKLAHGYLALVLTGITNPLTTSGRSAPESLTH